MHLVFDIFQGVGIAAAVGIRPFLPALGVAALAAGDVQIKFKGTDYSFLQSTPFLLGMVVGAVICAVLERRASPERLQSRPVAALLGLASVAVGALFFAGSLCRGGAVVWPGYVAGPICAAVGILATKPLLARARTRLQDASLLPLFAEGGALLAAVLSVLGPPVGPIVLALLLWLLIRGRGRDDQKYAGLRILR